MDTLIHYHSRGHWENVYTGYVASTPSKALEALHASVYQTLDPFVLAPPSRLLEIACGGGAFLRGLQRDCHRLGTDLSTQALRQALALDGAKRCNWIQADAGCLPFTTECIDVVVCLSSLWVFPDLFNCLTEWSRVLRRDGRLILHIWGSAAECRLITLGAGLLQRALRLERPASVMGPFDLNEKIVDAWLRQCGFGTIEWRTYSYSCPIINSHEYWAEFSSLAQTAFTAFRTADRETRIRVNTTLNRLLAQSQLENGNSNLTVSWAIGSISI